MFLRQISIEVHKTVKHPALWLGLAGLICLLALFILVQHSRIKYGFVPANGGIEQDLLAGLAFFNWIGGFIYAATASLITAYDYPDLRLWLTRGLPRPTLLFARLTVILLISALMICFSILCTAGLAALSRTLFFHEIDVAQLNRAALLPILLRMFWSSLPYLALAILLGILSRSATFAAGGMILYADVLEKLLLSISDRYPLLTRFLPGQLSLILQTSNYTLDRAASQPVMNLHAMTGSQAAFAIGIIFILLCGLSFAIFSRQDLGG